MKWSILQKGVSKITKIMFFKIDRGDYPLKTFEVS